MEQIELKKTLFALLEPIVKDYGAEVVDLELKGSLNSQILRLLVYKESGITVDLCGAISREASDLLDIEEPISGRYRLEVTSPGLDRPLRTDRDFIRANSRLLKVVLVSGRTVYGRLQSWNASTLTLSGDSGLLAIARDEIAKATIEVEL